MEEGDRFPTIPTFRQENKTKTLALFSRVCNFVARFDSLDNTLILLIRASNLRGALNIRRITNLEKVSVIFFLFILNWYSE